jgi:hypothetical protein
VRQIGFYVIIYQLWESDMRNQAARVWMWVSLGWMKGFIYIIKMRWYGSASVPRRTTKCELDWTGVWKSSRPGHGCLCEVGTATITATITTYGMYVGRTGRPTLIAIIGRISFIQISVTTAAHKAGPTRGQSCSPECPLRHRQPFKLCIGRKCGV